MVQIAQEHKELAQKANLRQAAVRQIAVGFQSKQLRI